MHDKICTDAVYGITTILKEFERFAFAEVFYKLEMFRMITTRYC